MKIFCLRFALAGLLLVPAAVFAAIPGPWTGPYIGIQAGLNRSSLDNFSSENVFTAGIYGGYDWQLSGHFVLGADVFYEWNQNKDHETCINGAGCASVNIGSNVYGVDGLVGFPVGEGGNFMPYVKVGYSHLDATGDNASGGSNGWRAGVGLEWFLGNSTSLVFQYMHGKYDYDGSFQSGSFKNDNFTVGVSFRF